jgi:hypothetical protein
MWAILVGLVLLLPSPRGTLWVPHQQAPDHFMVELGKPSSILLGLVELSQIRSGFFGRETLRWSLFG